MNFYALNEVPFNGWATLLGTGAANLSVEAQGQAHSELHLSGTAGMAQSAAGRGLVAKRGAGAVAATITAAGTGYAHIFGVGQAPHVLMATGDGLVLPYFGGVASMCLTATGKGAVSHRNDAPASLVLSVLDRSRNAIAARGTGLAELVMSGRYGIPVDHPRSGTIQNKRDRMLLVASDSRKISVPADVEIRLRKRVPLRVPKDRRN